MEAVHHSPIVAVVRRSYEPWDDIATTEWPMNKGDGKDAHKSTIRALGVMMLGPNQISINGTQE